MFCTFRGFIPIIRLTVQNYPYYRSFHSNLVRIKEYRLYINNNLVLGVDIKTIKIEFIYFLLIITDLHSITVTLLSK